MKHRHHFPACRSACSWFAGIVLAASCGPLSAAGAVTIGTPPPPSSVAVDIYFSPGANTEQVIAGAILGAKKRVWLAGYYFTSAPIAKALHEAHKNGKDVRIVLDRSQATAKYSSATYFHNSCVPVVINARYPIMHHKFVVIDGDTVGLASMNFTKAGSVANAENFNLFRRWPKLADTCAAEFSRLQREALPYQPGMVLPEPTGKGVPE